MSSASGEPVQLLLDLGNTRLKWALAVAGQIVTAPEAAPSDPVAWPWSSWLDAGVSGVAIASVAPAAQARVVIEALTAKLGRHVLQARTEASWRGLRCAYAQPERLGVDRWLGLIAAYAIDPARAAWVISAGTALTIDRLDPGGQHRGGLIAPGLRAMRDGLFAAAPALAGYHDGRVDLELATDSADAIASGCLQAAVGLIERRVRRTPAPVWLSGGDAVLLADHLEPGLDVRAHPSLVLEGLAVWADACRQGDQAG